MKEIENENLLDLNETIAKEMFLRVKYPWEVLPNIGGFIQRWGETFCTEDYYRAEENVWIAKSASISSTATILGPAIIGAGVEVRHSAYIRQQVIVGSGALVGNSVELKNSILFNDAIVPHFNYVGDSILGHKTHIGAGVMTSNLKMDRGLICIRTPSEVIQTGLQQIGAILGDRVEVGCNAVLNPGCIIGRDSNIYPLSSVRGIVFENSIYKRQGEIVAKI